MNRLFDTSVNVGLRQFYVLGAAGSIGNLFGFVGNVYIYGLSAPTIFCALCTLVIFGMTFWGIRSRHVKRAAYVIITLITFTRRERSCIWCSPWWQLQPFFQRLRQ